MSGKVTPDLQRQPFLVAANDASGPSKATASYSCDGTSDEVEIQAAIDALPS
jgi:hypothetical protein